MAVIFSVWEGNCSLAGSTTVISAYRQLYDWVICGADYLETSVSCGLMITLSTGLPLLLLRAFLPVQWSAGYPNVLILHNFTLLVHGHSTERNPYFCCIYTHASCSAFKFHFKASALVNLVWSFVFVWLLNDSFLNSLWLIYPIGLSYMSNMSNMSYCRVHRPRRLKPKPGWPYCRKLDLMLMSICQWQTRSPLHRRRRNLQHRRALVHRRRILPRRHHIVLCRSPRVTVRARYTRISCCCCWVAEFMQEVWCWQGRAICEVIKLVTGDVLFCLTWCMLDLKKLPAWPGFNFHVCWIIFVKDQWYYWCISPGNVSDDCRYGLFLLNRI